MNNSLQISTKIEDMLEEIESKRVSYQTMYECIQTKIVSKVTSLADQIRNETLQWYERIQQEQLKLLDQTDKFEDELTERLEQLNVKHQEIEAKIKKYDYIFNNKQLNDNKMNQVKRKLKRSKRRFDEAIEELNAFNLDDKIFQPSEIIDSDGLIGYLVQFKAENTSIKTENKTETSPNYKQNQDANTSDISNKTDASPNYKQNQNVSPSDATSKSEIKFSIKLNVVQWDKQIWQDICDKTKCGLVDPDSLDKIELDELEYMNNLVNDYIQNRAQSITLYSHTTIRNSEIIFHRKCSNEKCQTKWQINLNKSSQGLEFLGNQKCDHSFESLHVTSKQSELKKNQMESSNDEILESADSVRNKISSDESSGEEYNIKKELINTFGRKFQKNKEQEQLWESLSNQENKPAKQAISSKVLTRTSTSKLYDENLHKNDYLSNPPLLNKRVNSDSDLYTDKKRMKNKSELFQDLSNDRSIRSSLDNETSLIIEEIKQEKIDVEENQDSTSDSEIEVSKCEDMIEKNCVKNLSPEERDSAKVFKINLDLKSIDQLPDGKINMAKLTNEQSKELTGINEYIQVIVKHLYSHKIEMIQISKSNLTFKFYGRCTNTKRKYCQTIIINFQTKYSLAFEKCV